MVFLLRSCGTGGESLGCGTDEGLSQEGCEKLNSGQTHWECKVETDTLLGSPIWGRVRCGSKDDGMVPLIEWRRKERGDCPQQEARWWSAVC